MAKRPSVRRRVSLRATDRALRAPACTARGVHRASTRAQAERESHAEQRALRRADRRRRHLRHRWRLPPARSSARARASSCSRRSRASAAPGARTRTRASAPTATCTRSATASSRGRRARSRRAEEILKYMGEVIDENDLAPAHPLPAPDLVGDVVERRRTCGRSTPRAPTRARRYRFTTNFLWMCQGYYRHAAGLHARVDGHGPLRGSHRPPADVARGPRLPRQGRAS